MKGDKAQTRPARRTPPLRETHEGRQMKGDKTQTRPERRTPPVTKRRTHLKKELRTPDSKLFGEKTASFDWRSGAQDPSAGDSKTHPKDRGAGSGLQTLFAM